eukprot:scaffold13868_cov32-Attheya_sp.AAC.1
MRRVVYVRTICQAFGVDHTDPHWSYVLPRCIPINSLASKHKLYDHFNWVCWNCNPTRFQRIIQKKSRLKTSISPPVVPKSANEPEKKKDPPPPPESEKNNKKSTSTVPKSAHEPDKKKDPPPPPESEKKNKKSTSTVPKSAGEPDEKKDPPPLSPPKVKQKLILQMSQASNVLLKMKQAYEPDYDFIPVFMDGKEPSPNRGSEGPHQLEKNDLTDMTRCFWRISSPTSHPPFFISLVVITKIIMQCHHWNMYSLMSSDVHKLWHCVDEDILVKFGHCSINMADMDRLLSVEFLNDKIINCTTYVASALSLVITIQGTPQNSTHNPLPQIALLSTYALQDVCIEPPDEYVLKFVECLNKNQVSEEELSEEFVHEDPFEEICVS